MYDTCGISFAGMIGMCIYGPLIFVALVRTFYSFREERWEFRHKPAFHVFLTCYAIMDFSYLMIIYLEDNITTFPYVLHEVGLFMNLIAFSIVVHFWVANLPFEASRSKQMLIFESCIIVFNFGVLVASLTYTVVYGINCISADCTNSGAVELAVDGLSLFILSNIMFVLGVRLLYRIGNHCNWNPVVLKKKIGVLVKINITLFSCSVCYCIRVFFEGFLVYDYYYPEDIPPFINPVWNCEYIWFLVSKWIPYVIPSIMLLHLMRPKVLPIHVFHKRTTMSESQRGHSSIESPHGQSFSSNTGTVGSIRSNSSPVATSNGHGSSIPTSFGSSNVGLSLPNWSANGEPRLREDSTYSVGDFYRDTEDAESLGGGNGVRMSGVDGSFSGMENSFSAGNNSRRGMGPSKDVGRNTWTDDNFDEENRESRWTQGSMMDARFRETWVGEDEEKYQDRSSGSNLWENSNNAGASNVRSSLSSWLPFLGHGSQQRSSNFISPSLSTTTNNPILRSGVDSGSTTANVSSSNRNGGSGKHKEESSNILQANSQQSTTPNNRSSNTNDNNGQGNRRENENGDSKNSVTEEEDFVAHSSRGIAVDLASSEEVIAGSRSGLSGSFPRDGRFIEMNTKLS